MNLTGRAPYQKGEKPRRSRGAARPPNAEELRLWNKIAQLPCAVDNFECRGRLTIHHCGTGAGGRKDHKKVCGLCYNHHQGPDGIDGKQKYTKTSWQEHYGTEDFFMQKQADLMRLKF